MINELLIEDSAAREPATTGAKDRGLGRWALVILILLAFVLRIYGLGGQEFWFDEAVSANISGLGWGGALAYVHRSIFEHPPFYYLSLSPWQELVGTSEFAFRFYSVFWGVLFIPLLYALVKRLADERLALLAALVATFSPFMVAYSQEARMYSLLPCLALLTLLSFWNALERDGQPAWWLAYSVLLVVGAATHYLFALIWVVTTIYLLLEYFLRRRVWLWTIVVQLLLPVVVVVWALVTPGFRTSLVRVAEGEATFSLAYKVGKIMPTLMLAELQGGQVPLVACVLAVGGWALVLIGVWYSRRAGLLNSRGWILLLLFLVVPLAGSFLIPYGVLGRHLGYALIPAFVFMASGLLALQRRGNIALAVGILAFLLLSTYGLLAHYTSSGGSFGQALAYIDVRGQPDDLVLLTQPAQEPLVAYYNDQEWSVRYFPPTTASLTSDEVEKTLRSVSRMRDRLWLGPVSAWTADPEFLVERWLTTNAFQAEKVWFPDSTSVALYLTGDGGLAPAEIAPVSWEGRIRLHRLSVSPVEVRPGDALRLRFDWESRSVLDERYEVSLLLVDDQDLIWAERRSEPCGGWCPTDDWQVGELQPDQHALVIPPGTPPNTYRLQVRWAPLGGGQPLQSEEDGQRVEQVTLAEVTVLPPDQAQEPWDLPNPLQVTFGGEMTLLGYRPATAEVRLGEHLLLETHWRAEAAPTADYVLVVELVDEREQVAVSWSSGPSVASQPTSRWKPGQYLRGQLSLPLPGTLSPARYELRMSLVAPDGERLAAVDQVSRASRLRGQHLLLASVHVLDRPREFDMPSLSSPLEATVGRQANLAGYDLDLSQAHPGGQLHLTLYWQAGGPMVRPFKVFTHLLDAEDRILAQHDAPPGGGCCPANTWTEGEVIVDEHPIALSADLPAGTHRLVAGMYDEESRTRLPVFDAAGNQLAHDRIQIGEIVIEATEVSAQDEGVTRPWHDVDHTVFLPLLTKGHPPE